MAKIVPESKLVMLLAVALFVVPVAAVFGDSGPAHRTDQPFPISLWDIGRKYQRSFESVATAERLAR
jgi:hypothetical protein